MPGYSPVFLILVIVFLKFNKRKQQSAEEEVAQFRGSLGINKTICKKRRTQVKSVDCRKGKKTQPVSVVHFYKEVSNLYFDEGTSQLQK